MTSAELSLMSLAQLTEHYNSIASKPVKMFKSKGEAITRIEKLQTPAQPYTNARMEVTQAMAAALTADTAKEPAKKRGPKGLGIGAFCRELIAANHSNKEIFEAVKTKWPDASTTVASVAWYRNQMRKTA